MTNVNETPEVLEEKVEAVEETKPAKTNKNKNTVANLEAAAKKLDKITDDGKKHKQGDVVKIEAFGVVVETKF